MPDDLSPEEAAPLMCAGITTFNALRRAGALGGGRVAVPGIGGLGHLGVQFAQRLGYETIAVARGAHKEPLARRLGADHYVDSTAVDPSEALRSLGGVDLILATVTNQEAMVALFGGLRPHGRLIVIGGGPTAVPVPASALIAGSGQIAGDASGTSIGSEDTLRFSARSGVRPMIETMPLERAADAYERMMSGAAVPNDGERPANTYGRSPLFGAHDRDRDRSAASRSARTPSGSPWTSCHV
jgi:D-arabinose 1-dehydrogenase-like Zn-dependent alcohol dehydrogenase